MTESPFYLLVSPSTTGGVEGEGSDVFRFLMYPLCSVHFGFFIHDQLIAHLLFFISLFPSNGMFPSAVVTNTGPTHML